MAGSIRGMGASVSPIAISILCICGSQLLGSILYTRLSVRSRVFSDLMLLPG